jgi:hypothetical protein
MTARCLHGTVDSKSSCASDADNIAIHPWLRNQQLKRSVEIGRPPFFSLAEIDARHAGGRRFIVESDELLSAFLELEATLLL